MPRDNIVELQELFRWRLSVNDSRVRINPDTQVVRLSNQDGKSILLLLNNFIKCFGYSFQYWF